MDKDEAKRALDIAEKKLSEKDYDGAKKFANKAQNMYPELDGLKQVSMMIDVYISAAVKINGGTESEWYGVLGVDSMADDETVRRQYKKLALLLHPDKNKFNGAEGAFKLVLHAWSLLSDWDERVLYDERRMGKEKKPPTSAKAKEAPVKPSTQFWTKCTECKTRCEYWRDPYLNKTVLCPMCGKTYIATEQIPRANVRQARRVYNVQYGFYI
ncbi:DNAJ heat shock N-terminal domain-containing protein [Raphanus sativus]|uniref:Chaperone protein dnaJ 49 n=1 Tax=Raphanus sativus TaxID=3726 RepID=A0A9W3C824_RAPSA|nr:chaperone protein dnaJ 49 [Raphanus sativus]KAJ4880988.1 DNAJ heat shock N-terminal domain-containing protein [Raphanus sativus]